MTDKTTIQRPTLVTGFALILGLGVGCVQPGTTLQSSPAVGTALPAVEKIGAVVHSDAADTTVDDRAATYPKDVERHVPASPVELRRAAVELLTANSDRFMDHRGKPDLAGLAPLVEAEFLAGARLVPPITFISRMLTDQGTNFIVCIHAQLANQIRSAPRVIVAMISLDEEKWMNGLQEFTTGHATEVESIEKIPPARSRLTFDLLAFHIKAQLPYKGGFSQYYALLSNADTGPGLCLLRTEDENRAVCYADYPGYASDGQGRRTDSPGSANGLASNLNIPGYPVEDWVRIIETGDQIRLIAALYFLCGTHDKSHPGYRAVAADVPHELEKRGILDRLLAYDHLWVREYARRLRKKALMQATDHPASGNKVTEKPGPQ